MERLVVLKLSGHLIKFSNTVRDILNKIKSLTGVVKFVIIPGGSVFADFVKELQEELGFSDDTAHWLAIKSMEMYGAYLASLDISSVAEVYDFTELHNALRSKKIPILMPYRIIKTLDELPHKWDVTSDSISVYIGGLLNAYLVILVKLVDGILDENGHLIKLIPSKELHKIHTTVIDNYVARLLERFKIYVAVFNAFKAYLLEDIINLRKGDYTLIIPE